MWEAFALQKLLTFFQQKYQCIWDINIWNFNNTLTNDVVSFEQPDPGVSITIGIVKDAVVLSLFVLEKAVLYINIPCHSCITVEVIKKSS